MPRTAALLVLLAACGSAHAAPMARVHHPVAPPAVAPPHVEPPPVEPPPPATPRLESPTPPELVRPRLVGIAQRGGAWALVIEDSAPAGERVVFRSVDDVTHDVAPPVPLAPPIAFAHSLAGGALVLVDEHGDVTTLGEHDAAPAPFVHLPSGPLLAASTRMAVIARSTGFAGVAIARVADDEVHPFSRPHPVEHEHVTVYPLGAPPRRPIDLEQGPELVTAWLGAAVSETERAVVRIESARPRGDSLDGTARAVVHTLRFEGSASRRADAPAPAHVTLDAITEYAPDGTLVVAFLDAHDGPHALVALAFPPQRGPVQTVALDAPGPLTDGDAALAPCHGALYAVTATDVDLGVQRVLPTPGERTVVWHGDAAHEGHVLATACDDATLLVALQRAPALAQGSLVFARIATD